MDPAIILQNAEARMCKCGAAGSGEGHNSWCPAKKFDTTPDDMSAADALMFLGIKS